ncbi:MAG: hypothetical protein HQ521_08010 [Bacteroidetes bacterium]|nr:hypothetical protein [Bacteroidota bacterium]
MCFGKSKTQKKNEEKVIDMLKKAAGEGGVPSTPIDMSTEMIKSQSKALKDIAGALDEVAKGIEGKPMDMDKIKKAGEVDKKLKKGVEKGFVESVKGIFSGILKWLGS